MHILIPRERAPARLSTLLALGCLMAASFMTSAQPGTGMQPAPGPIPAARQANNVAVLTIEGEITDVTARSIERRITMAKRAGADALVIELNTPGGELGAVLTICNAIKSSPIPNTVAWINPDAYSGGAIIALACREIVTSAPATMGDSLIVIGGFMKSFESLPEHERQKLLSPLVAEVVASARRNGYDELLVQGIVSRGVELWQVENRETGRRLCITRSEYQTIFGEDPPEGSPVLPSARRSDTPAPAPPPESQAPPTGSRGQVAPGVPEPEARRAFPKADSEDPRRFIPGAPELGALTDEVTFNQLQDSTRPVITGADRGKWSLVDYVSTGDGPFVFKDGDLKRFDLSVGTVRNDEELKAFFGARYLLRLDQSWSETLVNLATSWPVRVVLIAVFLIALFLEMTHPGLILPGSIAALALVGLIAPPMLINLANWWEIAAIASGIFLVCLEIFVIPGFGVVGIAGILALFGGLVGTFVPEGGFFPDTPGQQDNLLYGVATLLLAVATAGVGIYFISRHFGSLPLFGRLVLRDPQLDDNDELLGAMAAELPGRVRVGATGRAVSALRPSGRAEIDGRIVDVVSELGYIREGSAIVVKQVSEFRIAVEKAPDSGASGES